MRDVLTRVSRVGLIGWLGVALLAGCSDCQGAVGADAGADAGVADGGADGGGDAAVFCAGGCDDSIPCTADSCSESGCVHVPDDALCGASFCSVGGRCDVELGCVDSVARDCADADACTEDSCDEEARMCAHAPIAGCVPGVPDTCETAQRIELDGLGRGSATVSFGDLRDDYLTRCGREGGRDAVFYFEIDALSDVMLTTTGRPDTVLGVGFGCDDLDVVCNDDRDPRLTTLSQVFLHRVGPADGAPMRVYALVDAFNDRTTAEVTLEVRVNPASVDACGAPLDVSSGGTVLGFIGASGGTSLGSCQGDGATGREAVLRLVGPADGEVADLTARSSDFVPDLYVRTAECASGSEAVCVTGDGASSEVQARGVALAEGVAGYVFVDGATGAEAASYVIEVDP